MGNEGRPSVCVIGSAARKSGPARSRVQVLLPSRSCSTLLGGRQRAPALAALTREVGIRVDGPGTPGVHRAQRAPVLASKLLSGLCAGEGRLRLGEPVAEGPSYGAKVSGPLGERIHRGEDLPADCGCAAPLFEAQRQDPEPSA